MKTADQTSASFERFRSCLSKGPTCSRENLVEVFPGNLDTLSIVNDIKLQDFLHIHEIICTSVGIFFVDVSISFESTSGLGSLECVRPV